MFGRRKKMTTTAYDKRGKVPVIRASICTGEQVIGFKDINSGKFEEIMCIRSKADLRDFMREFQVSEEEIHKEW